MGSDVMGLRMIHDVHAWEVELLSVCVCGGGGGAMDRCGMREEECRWMPKNEWEFGTTSFN
jgi:hypothetical protein